jgi:hypothetical protein
MELKDIVMKLVGPVCSIGDSNADAQRFESLRDLTGLVEDLLHEISTAALSANNHQDSMRKIGRYAQEFLRGLRD